MNKTTRIMMTKQASAILVLAAAFGLSACNKAEDSKSPDAEVTEPVAVEEPASAPETEPTPEVTEPAPEEEAPVEEPATTEAAESAAPTEELAADAGKVLYEKQCQACHANGLLEAPKFGDKEAWAPRIAKGKEILHEHSAKGFNKMPAQATGDVTEAQVHAAVDYMVEAAS